MTHHRIDKHPILNVPQRQPITFYWKEQMLTAYQNETIASALIANGIHIFGHHHKDQSPQGIFCANGQCSQCLVFADGKPVKACMALVKPDIHIEPMEGLPALPPISGIPETKEIEVIDIPVLIIGGGPAGLSAGIELGKRGIPAILIDDKHRLGGKLVLQTHRFFGSSAAVYAGTRGIDIATKLEEEIARYHSVQIWLNSTGLGVFSDQKVGVLKDGNVYKLIKPKALLVAAGAREKSLAFKGNTLPGVIGAGAFQTLVNRDLVIPAKKLFIVGGGNVGLIAGYHALQAGIEVAGLVEALPECGGYKVHKDKLMRCGVPVYTSHTILSANGKEKVESLTIAEINENFKIVPGTEKSFACDCVLIAVGLESVNEFYLKAQQYQMNVFAAGDADEIAEASAAIYAGKIRGLEIANALGASREKIPGNWYQMSDILKSKAGQTYQDVLPELTDGFMPVLHCIQQIPCDPCSTLCPKELIEISDNDIRNIPIFLGNAYQCIHCKKCVAGCPGLAITLVDSRKDPDYPIVSIPFEFNVEILREKELVTLLDTTGNFLGELPISRVYAIPKMDKTLIVEVKAPKAWAARIAGVRVQDPSVTAPLNTDIENIENETIICRCERVTAGQIRELIRSGHRDINQIKAITRAGMGACGGKTCTSLIYSLFKQEGIPLKDVVNHTLRPLFVEVPLGVFAGESIIKENEQHD